MLQAESVDFSEKDVETIQRNVFGTLWNVRAFYGMYAARTGGIVKPRSMHAWPLAFSARLHKTIGTMTEASHGPHVTWRQPKVRNPSVGGRPVHLVAGAARATASSPENAYERQDALRTLREALLRRRLCFAPFAPFFAEKLLPGPRRLQDVGPPRPLAQTDERVVDFAASRRHGTGPRCRDAEATRPASLLRCRCASSCLCDGSVRRGRHCRSLGPAPELRRYSGTR